MAANEKWNKIVNLHKQYYDKPESKVQNVWESIFVEILGYSRLEGEVDRHRTIQLGSTERVIPDIIVKNQDEDLFVVELKQHNIQFQPEMEKQLFSYLKQLRNNIGILVCDKLYIYGFDYAKKDTEQLKWQIPFTENNPDGIEFVEHFEKGGFSDTKIKTLVFEKNRFNINVNRIIEQINSAMITKVLTEYLQNSFTYSEINEALNQISISVTHLANRQVINTPIDISSQQTSTSISKTTAIDLFNKAGIVIPKKCTFASLNRTTPYCWANPNVNVLLSDWWFILNDTKNRILYCFMVPANTYTKTDFDIRSDKNNLIDLYIIYNNPSFEEKKHNISFKRWLVKQISY